MRRRGRYASPEVPAGGYRKPDLGGLFEGVPAPCRPRRKRVYGPEGTPPRPPVAEKGGRP